MAQDSTPLLEMSGITKRFGGVTALENVSLHVGRAEVVALIGENGAGKSTLMKVLGGVHQPDAGQIRFDGKPATIRGAKDAEVNGVAFIHQELMVLENLDVAANVFLGREPTRGGPLRLIDRKAMVTATERHLEQIGLAGVRAETLVSALSLAQCQMVEIAKALSQKARVIIMDEPTSSLTPHETDRLLDLIRELRASGVSVIYISHRLGEIQSIADRVVVLRDGKNAGEIPTREEIIGPAGRDRMVRSMVGRDLAIAQEEAAQDADAVEETGPARLEVRDLRTPRFPQRAISFSVRRGEVLGFAGLVGAGRTEVVEALFGVAPALGGEIRIDGQPVRVRSAGDAIAARLYLVPEDRRRCGLILSLSIGENITLPGIGRFAAPAPWGWIRRGDERKEAGESAAQLHIKSAAVRAAAGQDDVARLAALLDAPASTLSGGNQQKIVLAKWLALKPKVMIFDEPTRGVDVGAKAEIYTLIRDLAKTGVAVIIVSSDMEEVLNLSDRLAVMHEGRITGILPRSAFTEETVMNLAVGGTMAEK